MARHKPWGMKNLISSLVVAVVNGRASVVVSNVLSKKIDVTKPTVFLFFLRFYLFLSDQTDKRHISSYTACGHGEKMVWAGNAIPLPVALNLIEVDWIPPPRVSRNLLEIHLCIKVNAQR